MQPIKASNKMTSIYGEMERYVRDYRMPVDYTRPEMSPMVRFYRDKCIFLTGGTGFLGQLFVEKLLRTGVRRIYVLARPKRGVSTAERLANTFCGDVFARLRAEDPQYMDRVHAIDGNMGELRLGISDSDWAELVQNVQIVLHSAAEVRFDESLQHLLLVNLRGTREVLRLAESMERLEVVVHISTAYAHCPHSNIEERFYEVPMEPEHMILLAERLTDLDEKSFAELSDKLIEPWPNTYTYTKALAEELVRTFGKRIPVVVIRPSIVISTNCDPIPGWINNIYGLTGVLLASGLGFVRVLPYNEKKLGDFVCADFVINSTLAATWATYERRKALAALPYTEPNNNITGIEINNNTATTTKTTKTANSDIKNLVIPEAKVYHVIGYKDRPITYKSVQTMTQALMWEMPSEKSLWLPCVNTTSTRFMEFIYIIMYHVVPGLLFDTGFWLSRSTMRLMPMYRKAHKFMRANAYFMQREWAFGNSEMKAVYDTMSHDDRRFFPGDVRAYNFREFVRVYYIGIRLHVLKEYEYNLNQALTRLYCLWITHWMLKIACWTLTILWLLSWWQQCGLWAAAPQTCDVVRQACAWLFG